MTEPLCYVDPRTLIRFMGIMPTGYRAVRGVNPIPQEQRPGYVKFVPSGKSLAEVPEFWNERDTRSKDNIRSWRDDE